MLHVFASMCVLLVRKKEGGIILQLGLVVLRPPSASFTPAFLHGILCLPPVNAVPSPVLTAAFTCRALPCPAVCRGVSPPCFFCTRLYVRVCVCVSVCLCVLCVAYRHDVSVSLCVSVCMRLSICACVPA